MTDDTLPNYEEVADQLRASGDRRLGGPDPYMALLMGRVESKLDAALGTLVRHEDKLTNLEGRMDAMERHRSYTIGLALAVSVAVGSIGVFMDPKDFITIKPAPARGETPEQEVPTNG